MSHNCSTVPSSGTEYPLNPLDLSYIVNTGNYSDGSNVTACLNTFSPADLNDEYLDFILGDSFMRNVYALFNFGSWTNSSESAPPPYIQLLSVSCRVACPATLIPHGTDLHTMPDHEPVRGLGAVR